jgi:hypothetical protein
VPVGTYGGSIIEVKKPLTEIENEELEAVKHREALLS